MLNLEESLFDHYDYNVQKDLYLKGVFYVFGAILFLDILRSQISEVNLLQLVPGYYLFLVLVSFILIMLTSTYNLRIPFNLDRKSKRGTKTSVRLDLKTRFNLSFLFFFGFFLISLNSTIQIGLDTFDSYDEETLSNLWSFEEVLTLESILITIVLTLSQIPIVFITILQNEKDTKILPQYWKNLSFSIFVLSGFITPTIDGYTQFNVAMSAISLYIILISLIKKRISIKFNSLYSLQF